MSIAEMMIPDGLQPDDIPAFLASLSDDNIKRYNTITKYWWRGGLARREQLMPSLSRDWSNWLLMGGRGVGKNRSASEAIKEWVTVHPFCRIALVGPTAADVRDVVIEGESGILSVYPESERPIYEPSKRRLTFKNGAQGFSYSAEEPNRLRGPQHHAAYLDEIATYKDPETVWDNLKMGLRLGNDPRTIITTTPKPISFLRRLVADEFTVVSRGRTWDNRANLAPSALREYERIYAGTRIGRQELEGELLEEAEGALWRLAQIDALRVKKAPPLKRIVVAIDPSVTAGEDSDECGIVAAGLGDDDHGYPLADASCKLPADQWASRAIELFKSLEADLIIAETNQGGDLVEGVLRAVDKRIPFKKIHASRGKTVRAEPVAALYEQNKVHHVGMFKELEDEMVNWVPGQLQRSPNRADALVYALTELLIKPFKHGAVA